MRTPMLAVSAALLVSALPALAQSAAPPRRAHHSLVYDDAGKRVLLTGGSTPVDGGRTFTFFNDLWAFDGRSWKSLGESGQKLSGAALAWDNRRNRVLSFGGYAGGSLGDLRALVGGTSWNILGQHPVYKAAEPGFVHDVRRDRFVTFGGSQGPRSALGETWEWSDAGWSKLNTAGPPARQAHVMVFDAKRNVAVVFGGMGTGTPPMLGDTWEFNGTTWTQKQVTGPSPRASAGAAYDAKRGLVVIFGGMGADGFLGDTWSWDGSTWRKLSDTGPEARAMGYIVYDKTRDRIVLFGGRKGWPDGDLNDTWEWDGRAWRKLG